jgi:hypothetical protein
MTFSPGGYASAMAAIGYALSTEERARVGELAEANA